MSDQPAPIPPSFGAGSPPPPPPPPPPPTLDYGGQPPDADSRSMAMLCHLLGIFTGFIGPLIIWLIKKDEKPFVNDQGKEALNFQLTMVILSLACILGCMFAPLLIAGVQVVRVVFSIIATVQANSGVAYRYPICFRMVS